MSSGFINSFDGTKIFYNVEGEGPPLLFLYGLVCSHLHWQYQLEYFKDNYTTIWVDYRGHHNSEVPQDTSSMTIENLARDTHIVLDELKFDQVHVLGHSIGVTVALEFYKQKPSRTRSLTLANGVARSPLEALLKTNIPQYLHPFLFQLHKLAPQIMEMLWATQASNPLVYELISRFGFNANLAKRKDIEDYIKNFSKLEMIVFLELMKSYEKYNAVPWLDQIQAPTLIISSENDWVTPRATQEIIHQLVPNSHLELIRKGSHCPQLDIPDLVNIIIERFLTSVKN